MKFLIFLLILLLFWVQLFADGAVVPPSDGGTSSTGVIIFENPLKATTFEELTESIINFIFLVAVVVVPLMIIIAGFYFFTAEGDPKKVKAAMNVIKWSVIGFAVVLFARGIVSVIRRVLGTE